MAEFNSGGFDKSKPFESFINSEQNPVSVATTGVPDARASKTANGPPSISAKDT